MEIISIKTSRYPTRVYLKFSTGIFIPFFIDDFVRLSLRSGQTINDDEYQNILDLSLKFLSYEYGLRQIALSPKTEKILNQKIKGYIDRSIFKYKIPPNLVDISTILTSVVQKIKDQGLINDQEYVNFFVKKNSRKSKREIMYLLQSQGLDPGILSQDLFEDGSDLEKIKKLLIKKGVDQRKMADFNYKNKIIGFLYRKGFSLSDIKTVIDDFLNSG